MTSFRGRDPEVAGARRAGSPGARLARRARRTGAAVAAVALGKRLAGATETGVLSEAATLTAAVAAMMMATRGPAGRLAGEAGARRRRARLEAGDHFSLQALLAVGLDIANLAAVAELGKRDGKAIATR